MATFPSTTPHPKTWSKDRQTQLADADELVRSTGIELTLAKAAQLDLIKLGDIRIDARSTIASGLQSGFLELTANDALTIESALSTIVLAVARLEACVFDELEDPLVG